MQVFKKIIIGFDGSDEAHDAVCLGRVIAKATGAGVVVGSTFPLPPSEDPMGWATLEARSKHLLQPVLPQLSGLSVETRALTGPLAQALAGLASDEAAEAIVVGSTHRGRLGRALLGSAAQRLLAEASTNVIVAPRGYRDLPGRELRALAVGFDASPQSAIALRTAIDLAAAVAGTLRIISVLEPRRPHPGSDPLANIDRRTASLRLSRAVVSAGAEVPTEGELLEGDPASRLATAADDADLLLVGSRRHGPVAGAILGAVSRRLIEMAGCPLLISPRNVGPLRRGNAGGAEGEGKPVAAVPADERSAT